MAVSPGLKRILAETFLEAAQALETGRAGPKIKVGLTILGSEHGTEEVIRGGELAQAKDQDLEVVLIGPPVDSPLNQVAGGSDEGTGHRKMEELLDRGEIGAAVTMHYNFPVGVATVGKVITPGLGREMYLATTTGTAATNRVQAMVYNTICGIAAAKASGIEEPTVGILNVDGSRQVERALRQLQEKGYPLGFAETIRADGGAIMRGNDLLAGVPDVMICDTLTGNLLMKVFSAYSTGGNYEALGFGYGPGIGPGYNRIINIVSRASGAPVIANSILFAAACARGGLPQVAAREWEAARQAGLEKITKAQVPSEAKKEVAPPPRKPVTEELSGIDVLDLEQAAQVLWQEGIYAETGMGCAGPVVLVAPEEKEKAGQILVKAGYL